MTLHRVESPPHTWLAVAARPRGADWLEDDLRAFVAGGVQVLVSLLSTEEEGELSLQDEEALAGAAGLEFVRIAVADFGVPDLDTVWPVLTRLAGQARDGTAIAAHCRMGVGRSPLTIAALLVLLGIPEAEAWRRVAEARGVSVPDTEAQRLWVRALRPI